jgi:hypothetical protein
MILSPETQKGREFRLIITIKIPGLIGFRCLVFVFGLLLLAFVPPRFENRASNIKKTVTPRFHQSRRRKPLQRKAFLPQYLNEAI